MLKKMRRCPEIGIGGKVCRRLMHQMQMASFEQVCMLDKI
jgi:hypothetical protein